MGVETPEAAERSLRRTLDFGRVGSRKGQYKVWSSRSAELTCSSLVVINERTDGRLLEGGRQEPEWLVVI